MWWDERLPLPAAHAIPPIFPANAPALLGKDDAPLHFGGVEEATTKLHVTVSQRGERGSLIGLTPGNTPETGGQPAALHATLDLDCSYVRHANPTITMPSVVTPLSYSTYTGHPDQHAGQVRMDVNQKGLAYSTLK